MFWSTWTLWRKIIPDNYWQNMSKADQTKPNLLSLLLCTDEIIVTSTEKKTFFRVVQYKNSIRSFLFMTPNFGADSQRE